MVLRNIVEWNKVLDLGRQILFEKLVLKDRGGVKTVLFKIGDLFEWFQGFFIEPDNVLRSDVGDHASFFEQVRRGELVWKEFGLQEVAVYHSFHFETRGVLEEDVVQLAWGFTFFWFFRFFFFNYYLGIVENVDKRKLILNNITFFLQTLNQRLMILNFLKNHSEPLWLKWNIFAIKVDLLNILDLLLLGLRECRLDLRR